MDSYFAVTAPGLEGFARQELAELDLLDPAGSRKMEGISHPEGGVLFKSDRQGMERANLHMRTASRILARVGNFFRVTRFPDLRQKSARLPWERFISPGQPITMRVTCHASRLYHTEAVARNVLGGMEDRLGKPGRLVKAKEKIEGQPPQLVVVRLVEDICTVSVDTSGEPLHKRGYRLAVGKAPLRETLAAGLILASGWDRAAQLLDPFCGSGTIPIEAAMLARGIPPGINRHFAFMNWPGYDAKDWQALRDAVTVDPTDKPANFPTLLASDRDSGVIKMAQENAERAGVSKYIHFECQAVSSIQPPRGPGWVVTNPPYGERISQGKDLRNLYAQLGNVLRRSCAEWIVTLLCNDDVLLGQMGIQLDTSLGFVNGGISVKVAKGKVP